MKRSRDMFNSALVKFIDERDHALSGRLADLHHHVADWLSYIPQSFPHYTRHTVAHSEAIIRQMSNVLFHSDGTVAPNDLNAMEAYILCCAAYLHDAGMVVSDESKQAILSTDEWQKFVSDGSGANRWLLIQELRRAADTQKSPQLHFQADVQTRFLIAELIRRDHHLRAKQVITSS